MAGGESRPSRRSSAVAASIFGAFDGVVTVLGAVFGLSNQPHALLVATGGLAAAGTVSMAGGQLLSSDNDHGWLDSLVIGVSTGLGTLAPVAPYLVFRGLPALLASMLVCLAVAGVIVFEKGRQGQSWGRAAGTTFGILAAAAGFTLLCVWSTGAVG